MISIIIPIYNSARSLKKCVNSVLSQTYKDIEVLLINDGSTDDSLAICREYEKKDSRVVVINKEKNEGVDKARLTALENVRGEFLTFVDADDWLEKDAIETLYSTAQEKGADVIIGKMHKIYFHGLLKIEDHSQEEWMNRLIEHEELMSRYFISCFGCTLLTINLCAFLYRTSIVKEAHLKPSGLIFGEDLVMAMNIFPHINSLYAIDKTIYNYNKGYPGVSDKYLDKWLENARLLHLTKMKKLKEYNFKKAVFYQRSSLLNYLIAYVYMCYTRRFWSREENIKELSDELNHTIYRNLDYLLHCNYRDKQMIEYIVAGNARAFYSYVEKTFTRKSLKNMFYFCFYRVALFPKYLRYKLKV